MIYILYAIINRSFFNRIANEESEFRNNHIFINPDSYLDKLKFSMEKCKSEISNMPLKIALKDYLENYVPMFAKYQMRQLSIMLCFSIDTSDANTMNTSQAQANDHLQGILKLISENYAFGWKTLKINDSKKISDNSILDTIVSDIISDLIDNSSCHHKDQAMDHTSVVDACKRHESHPSLYYGEPCARIKSSIIALDSKGRKITLPYCELQFVGIYCINEEYCRMIVDCTDKELHINNNLANTDESLELYQWSYSMLRMFNEVFYIVFEGMKTLFKRKLKLLEAHHDKRDLRNFTQTKKPRIMALSSHFLKHLIPIFIFDFIESQKGIFMNDGSSFFNENIHVKWESQKFIASKCLSLLASAFPPTVGHHNTEEVSDKIFLIPTFGALFNALFMIKSIENGYPECQWITESIKTAKIGIDNGGGGVLFTEIVKIAVAICCKTPKDDEMVVKQVFYPYIRKNHEDLAASDDNSASEDHSTTNDSADAAAIDDDDDDDDDDMDGKGKKKIKQ